jgi:hypothetical protein
MSFHTAAGTRGRRKMRVGPVGRLVVRRITNTARRRRGRFMGMNVLVLHTVGAKSSKDRVQPRELVHRGAGCYARYQAMTD